LDQRLHQLVRLHDYVETLGKRQCSAFLLCKGASVTKLALRRNGVATRHWVPCRLCPNDFSSLHDSLLPTRQNWQSCIVVVCHTFQTLQLNSTFTSEKVYHVVTYFGALHGRRSRRSQVSKRDQKSPQRERCLVGRRWVWIRLVATEQQSPIRLLKTTCSAIGCQESMPLENSGRIKVRQEYKARLWGNCEPRAAIVDQCNSSLSRLWRVSRETTKH
jgi:hypothetical protein